MKYTSLLLTIAATFSVSAQANSVIVYEHGGYRGDSSSLSTTTSLSDTKNDIDMHDSISSLKVPAGLCAIMFENIGWEGSVKFFPQGDYPDLGSYGFNDKISSLHIINSSACNDSDLTVMYRHINFSGPGTSFPIGFSTRKLNCRDTCNPYHFNRDYNDDFTSVKIGSNACLIAYKDVNFAGTSKQFNENVNSLGNYSFNDTISSVVVASSSQCNNPAPSNPIRGRGGRGGRGCGNSPY